MTQRPTTGSKTDLRQLRGLVATVVTTGTVEPEFAACHEELRFYNVDNGFTNVEYRKFPAALVEIGRDEVAMHALREGYDWVLQIDADAAPFPNDALVRLLRRAYVDHPEADAIGGYCQLKQPPHFPTIDTGTGRWEEHYPGEGVLQVIRTGGHFLLQKTRAFKLMGPGPWHRTRNVPRAVDLFFELDNFARQRLDGKNPLAENPVWETLLADAIRNSGTGQSAVGEDSGFCDNLVSKGGIILVDTDLVVGHVSRKTILPQDLKDALRERRRLQKAAFGIHS